MSKIKFRYLQEGQLEHVQPGDVFKFHFEYDDRFEVNPDDYVVGRITKIKLSQDKKLGEFNMMVIDGKTAKGDDDHGWEIGTESETLMTDIGMTLSKDISSGTRDGKCMFNHTAYQKSKKKKEIKVFEGEGEDA